MSVKGTTFVSLELPRAVLGNSELMKPALTVGQGRASLCAARRAYPNAALALLETARATHLGSQSMILIVSRRALVSLKPLLSV